MIIFSPDSAGHISLGIDNIPKNNRVNIDIVNNLNTQYATLDKPAMIKLRDHLNDLINQVEKNESQTNSNTST